MESEAVTRVDPQGVVRRVEPAGLANGRPGVIITGPRLVGPEVVFLRLAPRVHEAEVRLRALVGSDVDVVEGVGRYLVVAGGKRLRPMLTMLGAGAVGFQGDLVGLMCVAELIHLGSLLHDDVVDGAELRRGRLAAHKVYGNAATILTGDFCLARAVLLAAEAGGHRAVTELARAVTAMAEGEVLQLQRAGNLDTTLDAYLEMVDKKSAALIAWAAAAAAYAAGREREAAALERFGRGVGVAFQITDDVLDYADGTGKRIGADLRERKLTLPLVHAMTRIPGLRARLMAAAPTDAQLPGLVAEVRESGALDAALAEAHRRVDDALGCLDALPAGPDRDALAVLGTYLVERAS
ncbi:MAG: polyprenyl synthetase family protein [Myxococcales bacterium]|nr:polyprenyl synthetase family protein [Myxococcales bacterium]